MTSRRESPGFPCADGFCVIGQLSHLRINETNAAFSLFFPPFVVLVHLTVTEAEHGGTGSGLTVTVQSFAIWIYIIDPLCVAGPRSVNHSRRGRLFPCNHYVELFHHHIDICSRPLTRGWWSSAFLVTDKRREVVV